MKPILTILFTLGFCIGGSLPCWGQFETHFIKEPSMKGARDIFAIDLDGDEKVDIVTASSDNNIAWYKNLGEDGFSEQKIISSEPDTAKTVFAADLDGDEKTDVISVADNDAHITWYQNQSEGKFDAQKIIITGLSGFTIKNFIDINGDKNADIIYSISVSDNDLMVNWSGFGWVENLGNGSFDSSQLISNYYDVLSSSVYPTDFDKDGDIDLVCSYYSPYGGVTYWYENKYPDEFIRHYISDGNEIYWGGGQSVYATDLNGDKSIDVIYITEFEDKIVWYKNLGDSGKFEENIIPTQEYGANIVYAADLDGDTDTDVIYVSFDEDKISWFENGGYGEFSEEKNIYAQAEGGSLADGIDLDGDGDFDIIASWANNDTITWYENQILGVSSFSTDEVTGGEQLVIFGQNFAEIENENAVKLIHAGSAEEFSFSPSESRRNELTFIIPETIPYGFYGVKVESQTQEVAKEYRLIIHFNVKDFQPEQGIPGDLFTLKGTNLKMDDVDLTVTIGEDIADFKVTEQGIEITVPDELGPGEYEIGVYSAGFFGMVAEKKFKVLSPAPTITKINPEGKVTPGAEITITGTYFDQPELKVKINGELVAPTDTTAKEIKVKVPETLTDGEYEVNITTSKGTVAGKIAIVTDQTPPTVKPKPTNPTVFTSDSLTVEISVIDEISGVDSVEVRFAGFGGNLEEAAWVTVPSSGDSTYSVTLKEDDFDAFGLRYQFRAVDSLGNADTTEVQTLLRQYPPNSIMASGEWSAAAASATIKDYQLIAIPFASQSVLNVLDELEAQSDTTWRLFQYQEDQSKKEVERVQFVEYPKSGFSSFEPGKGYFFIYRHAGAINVSGDLPPGILEEGGVTLTLAPGYNLIGNPYLFSIDWQQVVAHNANENIADQLKIFTKGTGSNTTVLAPFQGGFALNTDENNDITLEIPITAKNARYAQTATPKKLQPLNAEAWEVPLRLESAGLTSHLSAIGMQQEASESADPWDDFTLPRFLEYLELNFHHPEFFLSQFTKDIVPTQAAYTWTFEVATNLSTREVTLAWDNHYFGPNERELMLLDMHNYQVIDMRKATSYTFSVGEHTRPFKIFYGDVATVQANMLPESITVGQAYPNPMQNQFTIPVSLPNGEHSYDIQLDIYNITGQLVKSITKKALPGYQTLQWDRQNQEGNTVSPGLYLYRVNIDNINVLRDGRVVVR